MILHTLNKAPSRTDLGHELSKVIETGDSVLLIEDGVYQLLSSDFRVTEEHWSTIAHTIYVLREDAEARGISHNTEQIELIDYQQFVALSASHQTVISWY